MAMHKPKAGRAVVAALILAWCLGLGLAHGFLGVRQASAFEPLTLPDVSAAAVIAIDVSAGVVLYEKNPDEPRQPASTTKIATAVVVLDHADSLDEPITILESDLADPTFESWMGIAAGETWTVEQLLYGMMVPSGNDATRALARHIGAQIDPADPVAAFVAEMNRLADSLGLSGTNFTNPIGLENDPNHVTTARDLAEITRFAMERRLFREIVRTETITVTSVGPEQRALTLQNFNALLGGNGVHGVKTGSTEAAGGCLVIASWAPGRNRVVTVILGSTLAYDENNQIAFDQRWTDMESILRALDRDYAWIPPAEDGSLPGLQDELAAWQVELQEPASVVVPAAAEEDVRYRLRLGPPGEPESQVGVVLFFVGSEQVAERPVFQATDPTVASTPDTAASG